MLSEIWDPGWTATVDGVDARVYRTNFMFRGVVVDAGVHEIVLRFPANDVKWTLAFYLIPLAGFGGLAVAWLWTRRRPPPALPAAWPERPTPTRTGHRPRFSDGSDLPPWSGESRSQPG